MSAKRKEKGKIKKKEREIDKETLHLFSFTPLKI